jgi:hypothetical protein
MAKDWHIFPSLGKNSHSPRNTSLQKMADFRDFSHFGTRFAVTLSSNRTQT